jgi:uncharacterized protein (DUF1778 family)
MGKMKEHPRYNLVSIRLTDEEWEALRQAASSHNKKISQIVREMLCHLEPLRNDSLC